MITLYYWTTPNGHKMTIFLEEAGLSYRLAPINIAKGEQFDPAFLAVSPNNKIPAMVDHEPLGGGDPLPLAESGAMLEYLAEKTGRFLPTDPRGKYRVLQWLYWQMAHLGPMLGQNHHFRKSAAEKIPYAIDRYEKESERLYGILDDQLAGRDYICDDYSIADMACYPWILPDNQGIDIGEFPNIARWQATMASRPGVRKAYAIADQVKADPVTEEDTRKVLYGQGRRR
ncbi:MAG: glutathione S-transferase [Gammaproteobacteria bacterium BRH_c0]|nr:MAG: glutathione S-transferase [Gammaproteobacteria bacterium BRH_c0]